MLAGDVDEASNPVAISLLGANAVVHDPDAVADAIEQQDRRNPPMDCHCSAPTNTLASHDFRGLSLAFRYAVWPG
jgi:hypothetical protein